MGALIAKLLSFFGFRTLAISEQTESDGFAPDHDHDELVRTSSADPVSTDPVSTDPVSKTPSNTAMMCIRRRNTVAKSDTIVRKIQWFGPAQSVFITGSWLNWNEKVELMKNPNSDTIWESDVELPSNWGDVFELKFIVDHMWMCSSDMPTRPNNEGELNNILILSETEDPES